MTTSYQYPHMILGAITLLSGLVMFVSLAFKLDTDYIGVAVLVYLGIIAFYSALRLVYWNSTPPLRFRFAVRIISILLVLANIGLSTNHSYNQEASIVLELITIFVLLLASVIVSYVITYSSTNLKPQVIHQAV